MAIREIRVVGDRVLTKKCRPVEKMTPRISELIDDMFDTMYEANGVGLAAPQVGILKRIVVMDVDGTPHLLINPEILETSGSQTGAEGCLSLPGKSGTVTRPNYVKVRALDRDMQPFELEGTELLARCICHECDHLEGHMELGYRQELHAALAPRIAELGEKPVRVQCQRPIQRLQRRIDGRHLVLQPRLSGGGDVLPRRCAGPGALV